ncbi:MAG TPA: MerR family transcriptional regulator [Solirubrobacterales bacterium]|nr:MerR family transcriptional regulator [Solirubrobacterales bacterium]
MAEATLSIGEVGRKAGVSVSAIRFYERRGLLPQPERVAGRRRYEHGVIGRLGIISTAKRAGLSLAEIGALLSEVDGGAPAHEQLRRLATRKLPEVEATIERAQATRGWLVAAGECRCETLAACALFDQG